MRAWDTVLYERWKKNREVFVGALGEITEEVFDRCPPPRGGRCLDVGCGFGDTTQRLAELLGPEGFALGSDSSPEFIRDARREAEEAGVHNIGSALVHNALTCTPGPVSSNLRSPSGVKSRTSTGRESASSWK